MGGNRARFVVLLLGLTLLLCGCLATSASAILQRLPNGKVISYQPAPGHGKTVFSDPFSQSPRTFAKSVGRDAHFGNMDYNGGPVMPASLNIPIFWKPSNYGVGFPSGYQSVLESFFYNLAADSGSSTNTDSVLAQYQDGFGRPAAYNARWGGAYETHFDLPTDSCPNGAPPGDSCVSEEYAEAVIDAVAQELQLPINVETEYYLFTPPEVSICSGADSCTGGSVCAWHSTTPHGAIYAAMADLQGTTCDPTYLYCHQHGYECFYPNGYGDGIISSLDHEHAESVTDPYGENPAWTNWSPTGCLGGAASGFSCETGDMCNEDELQSPDIRFEGTASNLVIYNTTINGAHYLTQQEWSNQGAGCTPHWASNGNNATANFTASPGPGNTVNFAAQAASASGGIAEYVWQFNDGGEGHHESDPTIETTSPTISHTFPAVGTYNVALTAMAPDGTSGVAAKAITVHTTPPSAPPPPPPPRPPAPAISGLSQSHKRWHRSHKVATVARRRRTPLGTTFAFTLNVPATVHFDFGHLTQGRSVNGRCVAPTRRNRHRHRCARFLVDGGFLLAGKAGVNRLQFYGRFATHQLIGLGTHTAYATAVSSSGQSATQTLQFTVARR